MTTSATIDSDTFQAAFEALDAQSPLHGLRGKGYERFCDLGFPTRRDEEWRYTNIKPITTTTFKPASGGAGSLTKESIAAYTLSDTSCHQMVFVNGRFAAELSDIGELQSGVRLENIATISESSYDTFASHLGSCAEIEREVFTALNTAFIEDGLFLLVPRDVDLEKPVHVIFITTLGSAAVVTHPRILIVAEENSRATIIETYGSDGDGVCLTNPVTEIIVGENAIIDHYKIEQECEEAYHISSLNVRQHRSSNVTSHNYSFGGRLVRNNLNCALDGEGCEATFNGLTIGHGRQHVDNYLRIDHNKPNCNSWEYYKTVLDDQSRGVFCGRIYVAPDAQKTDAKQTSMNLLLSEEASITTMPQLDIFADDVKCTHGATIGQIEESQLFYLQSRGIDKVAAKTLLIYAFANETIAEIKIEELRNRLERVLLDRLPRGELLQGGL